MIKVATTDRVDASGIRVPRARIVQPAAHAAEGDLEPALVALAAAKTYRRKSRRGERIGSERAIRAPRPS